MREPVRGKIQTFSQSGLWQGRGVAAWPPGAFVVGCTLLAGPVAVGYGVAPRTFSATDKNGGVALALFATVLFIWAMWGLVKAVRALGLKRCTVMLLALFLLMVGFDVLTLPQDQSRVSGLFRQLVVRAEGAGILLRSTVKTLVQARGEFSFAYNGTRSPPKLPPGFPTPNPQATPIQVVARRAGQATATTVLPRSAVTPAVDTPAEPNTQLEVGGFAQVVNTLARHCRPASDQGRKQRSWFALLKAPDGLS